MKDYSELIGVARGCTRCTCTPRGGEKNFYGPNLQGKAVSAPSPRYRVHPHGRARVHFFKGNWDVEGGRGYLGYLGSFSVFWGRRLKKGHQLFGGRKVHPQTKSWLRLWASSKKCGRQKSLEGLGTSTFYIRRKHKKKKVSKKWTYMAQINTTRHSLDQTDAPSTSDA